MADINKLKDKIRSTIYPNGKGAIKASDHQAMLLDMADGIQAFNDALASTDSKFTQAIAETDTQLAALQQKDAQIDAKLTELSEELEELKNTSDYVADFFVEDLETLVAGIVDRIPANLDAIVQAWKNNLRVLVPYRDLDGYAVLVGFAEDLIYGNIVYHNGSIFIDAEYGGGKDWITAGEVTKQESGGSYDDTEIQNKLTELSAKVNELDKGEAYIMGDTLIFRNYADASIEGETLKL